MHVHFRVAYIRAVYLRIVYLGVGSQYLDRDPVPHNPDRSPQSNRGPSPGRLGLQKISYSKVNLIRPLIK